MSNEAVVDQTATDIESGADATGGDAADIDENADLQSSQDDKDAQAVADANLPPEVIEAKKNLVKDYHAKTQKLAKQQRLFESENASFKQDAEFFRSLAKQPWFVEAYDSQRKGKVEEFNLSKEEFDEATTSPDAMAKIMRRAFETWGKSMFGNELGQTKQTLIKLQEQQEISQLSVKYPDFKPMLDSGELRGYLDKGQGFASAYALAKLEDGGPDALEDEAKAEAAAEKLLKKKKAAAVSKGGVATPKGARIVKAKSFEDAFDQVLALRMKGVTEVKVERAETK